MNPRQLEYAILLSETRNFSQLAEILNISQPALSKQIKSLEEDLRIQIFDRTTNPLSLTPAGTFFIEEAKELLYKENQLRRTLERFKSGEEGILTIGVTPFRSAYLMPEVIKKVRDKFPKIQIELHETSSDQIRRDVCEGKYDFAIVNLPVDDSILHVIPLEQDELMLAVPKKMAEELLPKEILNSTHIDFAQCADLPFVVLSKHQEMRQLFDKLCASANIKPNIAAVVVGITTAWSMAKADVGATLLPLQFMRGNYFDNNLVLYKIDNNTTRRHPAIVKRRGFQLSESAQYAIEELLKQTKI